MNVQYLKQYSPSLNRDMECKIYGHAGRPVLFIPCQDGRFFDFENFKMTDTWQPWIDSGKVMVFSIDTIDRKPGRMHPAMPAGVLSAMNSGFAILRMNLYPLCAIPSMKQTAGPAIPGLWFLAAA